MNLIDVKGVGPKSEKILNKMEIFTPDDLINYYPFRYEIIKRSDLSELKDGDKIVIDGVIESLPTIFFFGRKDRMNFKLATSTNIFNVTIFNRGFLKNKLLVGSNISVIGKLDKRRNMIIASDLKFGLLPDTPKIEAVYHTVSGITGKQIETFIFSLYLNLPEIGSLVSSNFIR